MDGPTRFSPWQWLWGIAYVALTGVVIWSLFAARHWALTQMATPESVAAWQSWREEVRAEQDRPTPVSRRVPKSAEPPALVLMRDYFAVSLGAAILFCTVLYWVMAWLITGMLTSPALSLTSGQASDREHPAGRRQES